MLLLTFEFDWSAINKPMLYEMESLAVDNSGFFSVVLLQEKRKNTIGVLVGDLPHGGRRRGAGRVRDRAATRRQRTAQPG